jgi:hypothetical protein
VNHTKTILPDWKWGTAEGSRQMDRLLDSRLTFREKLCWLEEAETLSLRLRARRQAATKKSLPLREKAEIPKAGL